MLAFLVRCEFRLNLLARFLSNIPNKTTPSHYKPNKKLSIMPYPATLIAYAFVKKGIEEGNPVTQMKLQKMVYFAHGYHLVKYGKPLLEEEFEAWKFGPVIPSIYQAYKLYGSQPILDVTLISGLPELEIQLANLDAKALDSIKYTWTVTKNIDALSLSAWSHSEGSPWAEAFKPNIHSIPIKNEKIEEYFSGILSN